MSGALRVSLAAMVLLACQGGAARFPTSEPLVRHPSVRRAPAVVAASVPRLPSPARQASSEQGLVVLAAPVPMDRARETVARFFRAVTEESPEALDAVLAEQALLETSSGRHPARMAFRTRFAQLDYGVLRQAPLYREGDLETYRGSDAADLQSIRRMPEGLEPDEVYVRVRLGVAHGGKTRLFADEIGFLLRPHGETFEIARISEDFQF